MSDSTAKVAGNQLLGRLPAKARQKWLRSATVAPVRAHDVLYESGRPIDDVYFPRRGALVALVQDLGDGKSLAPALVGEEGVVGLEALLGSAARPFTALVLTGGEALRLKAEALRDAVGEGGHLTAQVQRYVQFLLFQLAQLAGCNRFHPLEQLFCSLLLRVREHLRRDEFELTHEQFARIAGVRRVGITQEARKLQQGGLIRYRWGKIAILDREGLRARACICHQRIEQARQHFLDVPPGE